MRGRGDSACASRGGSGWPAFQNTRCLRSGCTRASFSAAVNVSSPGATPKGARAAAVRSEIGMRERGCGRGSTSASFSSAMCAASSAVTSARICAAPRGALAAGASRRVAKPGGEGHPVIAFSGHGNVCGAGRERGGEVRGKNEAEQNEAGGGRAQIGAGAFGGGAGSAAAQPRAQQAAPLRRQKQRRKRKAQTKRKQKQK